MSGKELSVGALLAWQEGPFAEQLYMPGEGPKDYVKRQREKYRNICYEARKSVKRLKKLGKKMDNVRRAIRVERERLKNHRKKGEIFLGKVRGEYREAIVTLLGRKIKMADGVE